MYTTKISNSIEINKKDGEVKLNELKIDVNGYSEPRLLENAKNDYGSDKGLTRTSYNSNDWPKGVWYDLYCNMCRNLLKWKRKRIYKKD
jgi:hypothetical protein